MKLRLPPLVPRRAIAIRVLRPVDIPQPHLPVDLPLQHIVFQPVALLHRQSCEAGFQPAEHVVVLIAIGDGCQDPCQQTEHRLFQDIAAAAEVGRNSVALKDGLDDPLIVLHVPGGNCDVPEPAFSRCHQPQDVRRRLLHLGKGVVRLPQPDGLTVPVKRNRFSKTILLQIVQWGGPLPAQRFQLYRAAGALRQTAQLSYCLPGCLKDFFPALRLSQQCHSDRASLPHQDFNDPPLLSREICKAIEIEVLPLCIAGRFQLVAQLAHPVPGIKTGAIQPHLIGTVNQAEVRQLVPSSQLLCGFVKGLRRDLITPQLIKEIQQLLQEGGFLGGPTIYGQAGYNIQQRFLQVQ